MNAHLLPQRTPFLRGLFYLCVIGAAAALRAAEPAPRLNQPAVVHAGSDEILQLSPFEVSGAGDRGYLSTSAATASRIGEELKNIPQSLSVINQELIQDLAAQDLQDILSYTSSVDISSDETETYNIRGSSIGVPLVNGFRVPKKYPDDTADIERVEVLAGPASTMYGNVSGNGGIINKVSKRPKFTRGSTIQARYVDTTETRRAVFDTTGPIGNSRKAALRVVGIMQDDGRVKAHDNTYMRRYQILPKCLYKFTNDTQLVIEGDVTRQFTSLGQQLGGNYDYILYRTPTGALSTSGSTGGVPNVPVLIDVPDRANPQAHLVNSKMQFYGLNTTLTSQLTPTWALRVAGMAEQQFTKWNNPGVAATLNTDGRTINRGRPTERDRAIGNFFAQADLAGRYAFEWCRVNLLAGGEYSLDVAGPHDRRAISSAALPRFDFFAPDYSLRELPEMNQLSFSMSRTFSWAGVGFAQVGLFKERLLFSGGLRVVDFEQTSRTNTTNGPVLIKGDTGTLPQYGVVFRPLKDVSLYYGYSTGYAPRTTARADGSLLPPSNNQENEIGVKSSLFGGRASLGAAYFENKQINLLETDPVTREQFVSGNQTSKGYDLNAVLSITSTWQAIASYSSVKKTTTASIEARLLGATIVGHPKERWSAWTRYRVANGPLRGLAVGLGAKYIAKRSLRLATGSVGSLDIPGDFQLYDAMVSYKRQESKIGVQLNVKNLADKKYYTSGTVNRWLVAAPRTVSLEGTFSY